MGTVRWYGALNSGSLYFYYEEREGQDCGYARAQFEAVRDRLYELTERRDGNGERVVQLVAQPSVSVREPYIAYRWTSDWARNRYDRELVKLGGSLGRGVWEPFRDTSSCSRRLMMQEELVTA